MRLTSWSLRSSLAACLLSLPLLAPAATIYKCRTLSGGQFWSSATCMSQNAVYIGSATVPSSLTFEQQVAIAEQAERRNATPTQQVPNGIKPNPPTDTTAECKALAEELDNIARLQRQALSPQQQDRLTARRRAVHDRYNHLRCR